MTVWTLDNLHVLMGRYGKMVVDNVGKAVKEVAKEGVVTIIDSTPADTGHLVENWHISEGSISKEVHGDYIRSLSGLGYGRTLAALAKAGCVADIEATKGDKPIFINNNVRYVMHVNDGSPTTNPALMIEQGLLVMEARAKTIKVVEQI